MAWGGFWGRCVRPEAIFWPAWPTAPLAQRRLWFAGTPRASTTPCPAATLAAYGALACGARVARARAMIGRCQKAVESLRELLMKPSIRSVKCLTRSTSDLRRRRSAREVRSPPFEVTRVGWGYFPVTIVVTFAPELCLEPLELEHELCFNNEGSNFVHTLDLGALAAGVSPLQQRGG